MFGYVKPFIPELKVKEHELYKGIYCGLCRAMGSETGQLSRLTLSYDFALLTIVRLLATGADVSFSRGRCVAHPVKPRLYAESCGELRYSARVSALLMGVKIDENIADERSFKKLASLLAHPAVSLMIKRALRKGDEGTSHVADFIPVNLDALSKLEKEGCTSLDTCAEVFGTLTGELFSAGLEGAPHRITKEIGRGIGRFIYVCDACDDVSDDYKKGRFNPILTLYGDDAVEERDGNLYLKSDIADGILTATLLDLERCAAAAELICDGGDRGLAELLRNILYLGMPETLKNILNKRTGSENASHNTENN